MKNKMFSGWKDVFLFTLKQGFTPRFRVITIVLMLILFAGGFAYNIFSATGQEESEVISSIKTVYVIDESGISAINWEDSKQVDKKQFPAVIFKMTDADVEELGIRLNENEVTSVIAKVAKEKDRFLITVFLPNGSFITREEGDALAETIRDIVYEGLILESEIDIDKISYVISGMDVEFGTVGETAKSDNLRLLTTLLPMVLMFVLYFMVVIYGQSMGQIVSMEKSSKLMETLLVMTRPYGLIFGKIIATSVSAILQIALWMLAAIGGFVIGDGYVRSFMYENYDNRILSMFQELSADDYTKAFSTEAIVLTIIALCLAFLFYCMLAGAIASFASKADELGSVMMFYNLFLVLGFMGSYVIPAMSGKEWIKVLIRLIPMSAAFLLPGEIVVGTVSAGAGVLYLLVLVAWTILTAIFAGKVYKNQVFYKGKSLNERLPWKKKGREEEKEETWQYLHDEAGRPIERTQKIGYLFVAISPLAIFIVIQILASLVLTNIMTRVDLRGIDLTTWEVKDFVDYYHRIESTLNPMTVMVNHILIIATFGVWMYFIRRAIDRKNMIHVKSLMHRRVLPMVGACVVCGICLCFLANGVAAIEAELVPSVVEDYLELAKTSGFGQSAFAIFAAVCLAPIGEELLCRGVCLHFGKKALGNFWCANILQALLFGVLHMNWVQGVYAFFIGLVLGLLVERYDSLLPAMCVHFIVNFSSSTWASKLLEDMSLTLWNGILLVIIPGSIVIAALYLSREKEGTVQN